MSSLELPSNPIELANKRAEEHTVDSFDLTDRDSKILAELEYGADSLGFLNQTYFIDAHRAVLLPDDFVSSESFTYHNFMGISLEGNFITCSFVRIGRIIGGSSVRALCMAFDSATLLPYFDKTPKDKLMHVPVLSVESITQTS